MERGSGPESPRRPPALLRDLQLIVLHHLRAKGYIEAAHSLERETGLYLDAEHVANLARRGEWDEAERYVGAFAGEEREESEDCYSARIFFLLRRRKYIEALDRHITSEEGEVLVSHLKMLAPYDEEVAKMVATLENFRQRECLATASAREAVALEIKRLIEVNPLFQDKLKIPFEDSRLRELINQSLNWQHSLCKKQQNPKVDTLFSDHSCDSEMIICSEPQKAKQITKSAQKPQQITKSALTHQEIAEPAGIVPPSACARGTAQFAGCMTNDIPSLPHGVAAKEAPSLVQPPNAAQLLKHPTIPTGSSGIDYPMKRICLGQPDKVVSLLYANGGMSLLALGSNGILNTWKCHRTYANCNGKLWHPVNAIVVKNDMSQGNTEDANPCIALSNDEFYVVSIFGGKVSMFDFRKCQATSMAPPPAASSFIVFHPSHKATLMEPPPAATFIVFHPQNHNIIALGMEDSTIQIYNVRIHQVTKKLEGHHKKITGLSFSQFNNVLASSGADAQLCVWSTGDWQQKASRYMIPHANHSGALDGDTRVQFDNSCHRILVINESQLAIYDWNLVLLNLWSPGNELRSRISSAVFSCDGVLVYVGFCNGTIKIFRADLNEVVGNIAPSGHVQGPLSSVGSIYPVAIAVHPLRSNQIALGWSNGAVGVLSLNLLAFTISWQQCLPRTM